MNRPIEGCSPCSSGRHQWQVHPTRRRSAEPSSSRTAVIDSRGRWLFAPYDSDEVVTAKHEGPEVDRLRDFYACVTACYSAAAKSRSRQPGGNERRHLTGERFERMLNEASPCWPKTIPILWNSRRLRWKNMVWLICFRLRGYLPRRRRAPFHRVLPELPGPGELEFPPLALDPISSCAGLPFSIPCQSPRSSIDACYIDSYRSEMV